MKKILFSFAGLVIWAGVSPLGSLRADAAHDDAPPFAEVYSLIRSNLTGVTDAQLNEAAVVGLLGQLSNRVALAAPEPPMTLPTRVGVAKTRIFDRHFGYISIGSIRSGVAAEFDRAVAQLRASQALEGLALDLRFASGKNYDEAAALADRFLKKEKVLFRRGLMVARSTDKTNALDFPLVVLVNQETSGAAEVLAAILRENKAGLLIGSAPKTHAQSYKEFTLSDGEKLRIASSDVVVGEEPRPIRQAVQPDIVVDVSPRDEVRYFKDPYASISNSLAQDDSQNGATARPQLNEAELVRLQKQGLSLDAAELAAAEEKPIPEKPTLSDPALSRALDILKGLAVTARNR